MENSKPQMESSRVLRLPVQAIRPNPAQPRKIFDPTGPQELAASIVQYGILQPLTVRRQDGCYLLVARERRLRAAKSRSAVANKLRLLRHSGSRTSGSFSAAFPGISI